MAPAISRHSTTSVRQSRGSNLLPTYEPPIHPLNEGAQRALQNLPRDHRLDPLRHKLRAANNHLTVAAADINDRLQLRNAQYEKYRKRLEKQDSQEVNEQAESVAKAKQQTDEVTGKLEESVRMIIDTSAEVEGFERALKELQESVAEGGGRIMPTQSTLGASQYRSNQDRKRQEVDVEVDDSDNDLNHDTTLPVGENESATGSLKRKLVEYKSEYDAMSMSSRYAQHNDYVGFKKIVHDAHYPGDNAPPMPHASTWFASEPPDPTNPNSQAMGSAGNDIIEDDDEDIAVASERISIKCPITLLPMKDPVTSQKCPHSFEKEAILGMIDASDVRVGGSGRRGDGQKAMRCPVCEVLLTANDVKENPVLVRKIKRIQAASLSHNEDFSEDENDDRQARPSLFGRSGRPEEVTSSPMTTRTLRLKSERRSQAPSQYGREVSMVPNSQISNLARGDQRQPSSSAATDVVDLEDDEDEEDED